MRPLLRALLCRLREIFGIRDVFLFGGLACLARGLHLVYPPSAWIVVGALLVALALRGGPSGRGE